MSKRRAAKAFVAGAPRPLRGPLRKTATRAWKRHPQDWYVEDPWVSRRLFEVEKFEGRILDPACGEGRIVRSARQAGLKCIGSDIVRRAIGFRVGDFFLMTQPAPNIVSNVPFRFAMAFVGHALNLAQHKVAILLPAGWVQADTRSRWLCRTPLARIWLITPRPSMPPGNLPKKFRSRSGRKGGNGTTDYAWFVWEQGHTGLPQIGWLRRDDASDTSQRSHDLATVNAAQDPARLSARNAPYPQEAQR